MDTKNKNAFKDITMRHEEKFICSQKELFLLENRIKNLLLVDSHQTGSFYPVRSVYFDTFQDRMLQESLAGLGQRDKFRIRTYGEADSIARLEKKTSIGQLKSKTSCLLSHSHVTEILRGSCCHYFTEDAAPKEEFFYLQKCEGLSPKIIVSYDRAAYVSSVGNVRITFDRNIGASTDVLSFFSPHILTHPVLPHHIGILEVKYDGILPGYLARALSIGKLQRISFSKYGLCRNIMEHNGRIEEYYEF